MIKFDDNDMKVISTELLKERAEWRRIQERKKWIVKMNKPYQEKISTHFNIKLTK
jgi:hypothetical protein